LEIETSRQGTSFSFDILLVYRLLQGLHKTTLIRESGLGLIQKLLVPLALRGECFGFFGVAFAPFP